MLFIPVFIIALILSEDVGTALFIALLAGVLTAG
jgi:hypothetical protein